MIELGSDSFDTCKREYTHLNTSYNLGKKDRFVLEQRYCTKPPIFAGVVTLFVSCYYQDAFVTPGI